jgi:hypothetical protein
MSNLPTPPEIPPTTKQVAATLSSVINAAQRLISTDPKHGAVLRSTFLQFYYSPTFQLILGLPSPQDNQLKAELAEIKSTIAALSKAVKVQQPPQGTQPPPAKTPPPKGKPSAQAKGQTPTPPPTYASKAASPSRPSLVVELGETLQKTRITSDDMITDLNGMLLSAGHIDVKISATRYTNKGNLVLTAHHTTTQAHLNAAASDLTTFIWQVYKSAEIDTEEASLADLTAWANVKWSKALINSVPVGITADRGPWTPEECHHSLIVHNPSYTSLTVTQKPSWVHPPSTLKTDTQSSLVVAFEDPDGQVRRSLLANRQLYIHGTRAKVTCWKEKPRPSSKSTKKEARSSSPVIESRLSTPDAEMAEEPCSPTPTTTARKHPLPTTPSKSTHYSSPKKKRVGNSCRTITFR